MKYLKIIGLSFIFLLLLVPTINAEIIKDTFPADGDIIGNKTPEIVITFADDTIIDMTRTKLFIGSLDVSTWEETEITQQSITHKIINLFPLEKGTTNITVEAFDISGNKEILTFSFTVDPSLSSDNQLLEIDFFTILIYTIIGISIALGIIAGYIVYLIKKKNFTFRKFFIRHPIKDKLIFLYIPIIIAVISCILISAYYLTEVKEDNYAIEYVSVIGIFVALTPYTIQSIREKRKTAKYERAFAQFLFEIADAMRGGLNPTKSVIEIASTNTTILAPLLRKASDNIKIGMPFDEVMKALASPIKSDLVNRYAEIIGKTSKVGGDPAIVIHRAAKDMDDFIKVNSERKRQLTTQVTTIYISFFVLLIVLYQLISLFPSLGSLNVAFLGGKVDDIESAKHVTQIARMSEFMLKRRFFDLLIINSLGTGTIIGSFIDGHIKHGLLHSLILTAVSVVFFTIMIL